MREGCPGPCSMALLAQAHMALPLQHDHCRACRDCQHGPRCAVTDTHACMHACTHAAAHAARFRRVGECNYSAHLLLGQLQPHVQCGLTVHVSTQAALVQRRVHGVDAADAHPRHRAPLRHPPRPQAGDQAHHPGENPDACSPFSNLWHAGWMQVLGACKDSGGMLHDVDRASQPCDALLRQMLQPKTALQS